jgi:hypothetical protein
MGILRFERCGDSAARTCPREKPREDTTIPPCALRTPILAARAPPACPCSPPQSISSPILGADPYPFHDMNPRCRCWIFLKWSRLRTSTAFRLRYPPAQYTKTGFSRSNAPSRSANAPSPNEILTALGSAPRINSLSERTSSTCVSGCASSHARASLELKLRQAPSPSAPNNRRSHAPSNTYHPTTEVRMSPTDQSTRRDNIQPP